MNLNPRAVGGNVRIYLQHMRAEDALVAGLHMIAVILHKGRAALHALSHHLHNAVQCGDLPVALAAKAAHQVLGGEAHELL